MAEVFATFAGVASLIDVALRACNVLYDSCRYLRDARQLSQRLRRTIQSVESVLRSVNELGATYRQQQTSAGLPDNLPSAVNDEIKSIKAELDALSTLLPSPSSSGQLRSKSKFVLDRKKVAEVTQALDSHQITLLLLLQTFAQRNGIEFQDDFVRRLEHIHRQGEDSAKNLRKDTKNIRDELVLGNASLHANINTLHTDVNTLAQTSQALLPAQESVKSSLAVLHDTMSTGQYTVIERLNTMSQMLQSCTVLTAPTEDVLARRFRAKLQRLIMPAVEQCFDKLKWSRDNQLEEIKKKIDEMTNQLGSRASGDQQHDVEPCHGSLPETAIAPTDIPQDSIDLAAPLAPVTAVLGGSNSNYQNRPRGLHHQKWSFTKRRESPDYRVGGFFSPQKSYQVTVQFIPAQSLIQLRGLELSIANRQDQRGYYQICPLLSTFAVVPVDAEVFRLVKDNNVEGIQNLFQKGLAAPSDRNEYGADVNSRWRGYPPLIWLFRKNNRGIDTDDFESRTTNVTDIAVALLENGVDLLALSDEGFSVFDVAEHNGLNSQLVQALQRTGYNFGKVRYKTLLAQWIFFNPGVSLAKSTAVDRSQSKAGVVSRRAIAGDRLEE
ncbi:MAG: hypothetical protein LQ339_005256 [Xanthoria mediterranea]|nr:MAG: hypothetical protein LQ339_005256 [Xanthoria mediterranea]